MNDNVSNSNAHNVSEIEMKFLNIYQKARVQAGLDNNTFGQDKEKEFTAISNLLKDEEFFSLCSTNEGQKAISDSINDFQPVMIYDFLQSDKFEELIEDPEFVKKSEKISNLLTEDEKNKLEAQIQQIHVGSDKLWGIIDSSARKETFVNLKEGKPEANKKNIRLTAGAGIIGGVVGGLTLEALGGVALGVVGGMVLGVLAALVAVCYLVHRTHERNKNKVNVLKKICDPSTQQKEEQKILQKEQLKSFSDNLKNYNANKKNDVGK